uniref:Uncharacterized protein n=1 Tax=Anopheles atroparvus TaxID=41427 RepID=A0A182J8Q7_ANOAO
MSAQPLVFMWKFWMLRICVAQAASVVQWAPAVWCITTHGAGRIGSWAVLAARAPHCARVTMRGHWADTLARQATLATSSTAANLFILSFEMNKFAAVLLVASVACLASVSAQCPRIVT